MKKFILHSIILSLFFTACKRAEIDSYSGVDNIHIAPSMQLPNIISDTVTYTSKSSNTNYLDVPIVIQSQGRVMDINRPYLLTTFSSDNSAIAGTDYRFLQDTLEIAAGTYTDTIYFRLFKNPTGANTTKTVTLQLEPNAHFATAYAWHYDDAGHQIASRIRNTVVFGDFALEPLYWRHYRTNILGAFSGRKVDLLVTVGGLEEHLVYILGETPSYTEQELLIAAWDVQDYLNEQRLLGNIMTDENGQVIIMGASAQ